MKETERKRAAIINIVYYGLLIAIGLFAIRFGLGIFMPLLIAFIVAVLLQKPKRFLVNRTFLNKGTAATLCVFLLLGAVVTVIAFLGVRVTTEIKGFIDYIIIRLQDFDSLLTTIENTASNIISKLPEIFEDPLTESANMLFSQVREYLAGQNNEIGEQITGSLGNSFSLSWITRPLSGVISTAGKLPSIFIATIVTIVACCFMTADFELISEFISAQLTPEKKDDFIRAKELLKSSLKKMGKAYFLIMVITFSEMLIGLSILKMLGIFTSSYIIIICVGTAVVDIVPVLGTGTVLIPWAALSLINGNYAMSVGLIVMYAVISVVRQIIEPKLVAGQLGLPPFLTICAMYVGLKTLGVLGMFIAPMIIIMLKLLNDEGLINLWKSPSKS